MDSAEEIVLHNLYDEKHSCQSYSHIHKKRWTEFKKMDRVQNLLTTHNGSGCTKNNVFKRSKSSENLIMKRI